MPENREPSYHGDLSTWAAAPGMTLTAGGIVLSALDTSYAGMIFLGLALTVLLWIPARHVELQGDADV